MVVEIAGRFPTLNEHENAARTHWAKAAKLKARYTDLVVWQVKRMPAITAPSDYTFTWYVENNRGDSDNIAFGVKYIFDGLQMAGKLPNDSLKWVKSICHLFEVDPVNPRVVVEIEEA